MDDQKTLFSDESIETTADENVDTKPKKARKKIKSESMDETLKESVTKDVLTPNSFIGTVTYFNQETMIVGIRCDGIGYQTKAHKVYYIGEKIPFTVKDGEVIAE